MIIRRVLLAPAGHTRSSSRAVIVAAILGAGFLAGNGLAGDLSADRRVGTAAVYLAGVLAMAANFGVQSLLAALVVRVSRRFKTSAVDPVRLADLLAVLAIATLGAAGLARVVAWLGLGTFTGWSRFFPATTLVLAMIISLAFERATRQAWYRVIVPLFVLQLLLTAAFKFL